MSVFTLRNRLDQGVRIEWLSNEITLGALIGSGSSVTIEADALHPNTEQLITSGVVVLGSVPDASAQTIYNAFPTYWGGVWHSGSYKKGTFVRHDGTIWLAVSDTSLAPSSPTWAVWSNESDIGFHSTDFSNPHHTTASQVGAISSSMVGAAGGVPALDGDRKIYTDYLPSLLYDTSVAESHALRHAQGEDAMLGDNSNYPVTAQELHTHLRSSNNPHEVTIAQINGVPLSLVGQAGGVASLDGLGRVVTSQWPRGIRLTDVYVASNVGIRDALSPSLNIGDTVIVTDPAVTWIWTGAEFIAMLGPDTNGILSVNGQTDPAVSLTTASIPESGGANLYFTAARVAATAVVIALQNQAHARNRDVFLDYGGPAQVSASSLKNHLIDSGNPHSVTAQQAGAIAERATFRNVSSDYTLTVEDVGVIVRCLAACNINLPMDLGGGFQCTIVSVDGHTVTISAGVGNLKARGNTLNQEMASCVVYFMDPNRWEAIGNLV